MNVLRFLSNRPSFWLRSTAAALSVLPLGSVPAGAAEGPAVAMADNLPTRDWRLTVRAREAMHQDRTLASLQLGVTVRSAVATVWGVVPSPLLARRAEDVVRKVPGIVSVRSDVEVRLPDDPTTDFLRWAPPAQSIAPEQFFAARHQPAAGPMPTPADWNALLPVSQPRANVSLLPPVSLGAPVAVTAGPPAAEPASLSEAVERLCRSDVRFQGVRAEVQDGVVRLSGVVGRGEDLMALAQLISRRPGVRRVVIQDVRSVGP